jgi:hypothetical protein
VEGTMVDWYVVDHDRAKAGDAYSFSATLNRNGTFHLTTLGDYSALGTGTDFQPGSLHFGKNVSQDDAWNDPSLPIEYALHNADREQAQAKRISLCAGAGAIAWYANLVK